MEIASYPLVFNAENKGNFSPCYEPTKQVKRKRVSVAYLI